MSSGISCTAGLAQADRRADKGWVVRVTETPAHHLIADRYGPKRKLA